MIRFCSRCFWVFALFFGFFTFLILPRNANALANLPVVDNEIPVQGSSEAFPSGPGSRPYLAVGIGGFNGKVTYVKVFVPVGTPLGTQISVDEACNYDLGGTRPRVNYRLFRLDPEEKLLEHEVLGGQIFGKDPYVDDRTSINCFGGTSKGVLTIGKPAAISTVHPGYMVYYIESTMLNDTSEGSVERSFRLSVPNSTGGIIAYSNPLSAFAGQFNTFGIYQRNASTFPQQQWNFSFNFAPSCSFPSGSQPSKLLVYDFDYQTPGFDPQTLSAELYRQLKTADPGGGWGSPIKTWRDAELGRDGQSRELGDYNVDRNYRYKIIFKGINHINTIQISVPFDQFDARAGTPICDGPTGSPPQASCTLASPSTSSPLTIPSGSSVDVSLQFKNTGTIAWNNTYSLGGPGTIPGGTNVTINSVNPGSNTRTFTFRITNITVGATQQYYMQGPNGQFGAACTIQYSVGGGSPYLASCNATAPSPILINQPQTLILFVQNLGTKDWPTSRNEIFLAPDSASSPGIPMPGSPWLHLADAGKPNDRDNLNMSFTPTNLGLHSYVYHVIRGLAAGNATLATCRADFMVYDNPTGVFFNGGSDLTCTQANGTVNYQNSPGIPTALLRVIRTSDGQSMGDVGVGAIDGYGPSNYFDKRPFIDWRMPPHEKYKVELHMQNSLGEWQPAITATINSGQPCMKITACSAGSPVVNPEVGDPISSTQFGRARVLIENNTQATFDPSYGYAATISTIGSSPTDFVANPALPASIPANIIPGIGGNDIGATTNLTVNRAVTITVDFTYQGVSLAAYGFPYLPCNQTIIAVTIPYLKAYGGDVIAGVGFDGSCSASVTGGVRSYIRPLTEHNTGTNRSGSGSQLGVFSWGSGVSGFASAMLRDEAGQGNYLTFGKTGSPSNSISDPIFANNLTSIPPCLPDFYQSTQFKIGDADIIPINSTPTLDLNDSATVTAKQYLKTTGDLNVWASGVSPYTKRNAIFVTGNVHITSDITYPSTYTDIKAIPSLAIIVRGNIYIHNNVGLINGMFIAQKNGLTGGNIYTCSHNSGPISGNDIKGLPVGNVGCTKKLTVRGSLIADNIVFNRSNNTLRDSKFKENSGLAPAGNSAAEEIIFSPEVYLSRPVFKPKSPDSSGNNQYIGSYPPVL